MAKEIEGIGWEKSEAVSKTFETPLEMCAANQDRWRGIAGIGKVLAERIVLALRGRL